MSRPACIRRAPRPLGVVPRASVYGDETTIKYLAGLVGNPRREAMNKESLFPRSGFP